MLRGISFSELGKYIKKDGEVKSIFRKKLLLAKKPYNTGKSPTIFMILEGRTLRDSILAELRARIATYTRAPKLRIILVGDNPASHSYIRQKQKAALEVGIECELLHFPVETTQDEVLASIHETNSDASIDGLIVQLPLPAHIHTESIIEAISPTKDVDGYCKQNIANVLLGIQNGLHSCTPKGIMKLLSHYEIDLVGKNAVMIGYGAVGKPMAAMLANAGATVSICTQHTKDPSFYTQHADIIVVAVGRPGILTGEMVKPGAIVIDVGINRIV